MRNNLILLLPFFLLTAATPVAAQNNVCECCAYHSLRHIREYEQLFPPASIRAAGTKALIFYTRVRAVGDQTADSRPATYREIEFRFDAQGYVAEIIQYGNGGVAFGKNKLVRDVATHNIQMTTLLFLDPFGNAMTAFPSSTTDYFYDEKNLLTKTKVRGLKGEILPDSLASYQQFEYDILRRVIRSRDYSWYPTAESLDNGTETVFNDTNFTSRSRLSTGPDLLMTSETSYNTDWQPVRQVDTDPATGEPIAEQNWKYDDNGRLVRYTIRSFSGGSECPDGGTFEETHTYTPEGILQKVEHVFDGHLCEIMVGR